MPEIVIPDCFKFLFDDAPYKVTYGGRGSGKSHSIARALLIQGAQEKHRVLACREFQNSVGESVHKLFADLIEEYDLHEFYEIQKTTIIGRNGTEFLFAGLRHNVSKIKSFEGCTRVWVEEAQAVSKGSWDILIPTVMRTAKSQIWISMNPDLNTDETYQRFIAHPPSDAIVRKINWSDNPFFPVGLRVEMLALKEKNLDEWLHIWEGHPRQALEGAIYANEMRQATEELRICSVDHDKSASCFTAWDLGWSDMTSIWVWQKIGFDVRVIDFYQNRMEGLDHYIGWLERRGYKYERHFLPHDANQGQLSAAGKTIATQLRTRGMPITVLPQLPIKAGIAAARTLFPRLWFDEERCADGLDCLRRYRYDVDQQTGQYSSKPLHDDASHGADALRQMAVAINDPRPKETKTAPRLTPQFAPSPSAWGAL
ncbi:PBSX family phage terminase large subunit [Acetobacter sacchari]|uniref:PBSX family phage terminase large subunit n=1 Tax=Acetobacter sacchari TaxID=2661687 RepID=A0ABS3M142_9PROT|nr:PBSX family phage terminase large subunit [Acetobacter sacchari]MBO1361907.1 PBSX family phage terminase large subunit [Acetobacter sacchari]